MATLIPSQERENKNTTNGKGGLPASVIPEKVLDQTASPSGR